MPRKFSLTRSDFAKTRAFQRVAGSLLSLSYGAVPGRTVPGGAVVVSKKVAKSAVVRNRIKRAVRPLLAATLRRGGPSIIVHIRKAATSRDLRSDLVGALAKIRLPL